MYIEAKWLTNCTEAHHEQKYVHKTRVLRQLDLNRKCTVTHLRAITFSQIFRGYTPGPPFTAGRGNERATVGLGRGGRGVCSPNKILE
jgi:hypothetical protein